MFSAQSPAFNTGVKIQETRYAQKPLKYLKIKENFIKEYFATVSSTPKHIPQAQIVELARTFWLFV